MLIGKTLEHQVLPVPFHILTLWGIWCPGYVEPWLRRIYTYFTVFVITSEILLTIEIFVHLIIIISAGQFELDVFFIMTSLTNGLYKALNILLTRERIVELLTMGFDDRWRVPRDESEKKILVNYTIESWRIQFIYALACLAGVSIKLIGPMMKPDADLELPTPAWYPYDVKKSLHFWISYVQQMFVGGAIISMHIGADTMLSGFMLQSCIQMKLLNHRLRNFLQLRKHSDRHSKTQYENRLIREYIYDHQFIYSYAYTLNKNFAGWLIAVLIVVMPNICINVYFLSFSEIGLNLDFITSLGLFAISLFQIYLPCWYGNEVTLHSMEIGNAAYEMDWVNLTPDARKAVLIMMLRAAKPIRLTAAHVINMNIKSFLSIMKTSYSVLSVLKQK